MIEGSKAGSGSVLWSAENLSGLNNCFFTLLPVAERGGDPGAAGLSLLARHALPDDSRLLRHERGAANRLVRPPRPAADYQPRRRTTGRRSGGVP